MHTYTCWLDTQVCRIHGHTSRIFFSKQPQQAHASEQKSFVAKIFRPLLKRQPFQQKQFHVPLP